MEYPGPNCRALGISVHNITPAGISEKVVQRETITNSLVLEIYRYCEKRKYSKSVSAKFIISLGESSDDIQTVKNRIQQLLKTRDKLRKGKNTTQVHTLDNKQFSFCHESTSESDTSASMCIKDNPVKNINDDLLYEPLVSDMQETSTILHHNCLQKQTITNQLKESVGYVEDEFSSDKQFPFAEVDEQICCPQQCTLKDKPSENTMRLSDVTLGPSLKKQCTSLKVATAKKDIPLPCCHSQESIGDPTTQNRDRNMNRDTMNSNTQKTEQHLMNTLQHEICKRQKFLATLDENVSDLKHEISELEMKQGKYGSKNVKRREKRMSATRDELKISEEKLRVENKTLSTKVSLLEAKVSGLERTVKYERRQTSYLRVALRKSKKRLADNPEHQHVISQLKAQQRLTQEIVKEQTFATANHEECLKLPETEINGTYTENMRECIVKLVSLEVATDKVSPIIDCVFQTLCNYSLTAHGHRLPRRPTVVNIVDESQYLMKSYFGHKIQEAHHWGLGRDGTSRNKVKILDTSVTLSNGDILPFGYKSVARETAQAICETSVMEITEVVRCSNTDDSDEFMSSLLGKLSYFMSDRAANEKSANRLITEWRDATLEMQPNKEESMKIHSFYCMAHTLLGFHDYGSKEIEVVQRNMQNEGVFLGRDCDGAFRMWRKEPVHLRVPRHMSELAGPVGDEKSGLMDKWHAHCVANNLKSRIENYRDNRFNGLFAGSMQVLHHRSHLLSLIDKIQKPNLKVKSLSCDLRDGRVLAIVHAVAIAGAKLTGPYWELVTSGKIPFLRLYEVINPMHHHIKTWIDDLDTFMDPNEEPAIPGFTPHRDELFNAAFEMSQEVDMPLFREISIALLTGIRKCIEKQLADFLEDGIYSVNPSDKDLENTANSGTNNLACERHFGYLDSSQNRRRNASLHYHSSILMLKSHGIEMIEWLNKREDRKNLWKVARAKGIDLRSSHQAHTKSQVQALHDDMEKACASKETKAKKRQLIDQHQCKTVKGRKQAEEVHVQADVDVGVDDWVAVAYENGWFPGKSKYLLSIQYL